MDLGLTKQELAQLPKPVLHALLGVKKRSSPKKAGKAQLVQALVAKPPATRSRKRALQPRPRGPAAARAALKVAHTIRKPHPWQGRVAAPAVQPAPPARLGDFSRAPAVCISSVLSHLTVGERVRLLPCCKGMQGQLREPLAWAPTHLGAEGGIALKLGLALRERGWRTHSWWLVQVLQQATALQLDVWKARYMYAGLENESDSEDEPAQLHEKRAKRDESRRENDKYNARSTVFDHCLRLTRVRQLCMRGLDASQCQLVRRNYRAMGVFSVAWSPDGYTVLAEDRAPDPFDLRALAQSNFERAVACRADTLALPDAFWPRRTVQSWTIQPDPALSITEALFLRDFPMVCKVWGGHPGVGRQKACFHFTCGELPQVTKKAARQLYTEVLEALSKKYPAWTATALAGRPLWVHKAF